MYVSFHRPSGCGAVTTDRFIPTYLAVKEVAKLESRAQTLCNAGIYPSDKKAETTLFPSKNERLVYYTIIEPQVKQRLKEFGECFKAIVGAVEFYQDSLRNIELLAVTKTSTRFCN